MANTYMNPSSISIRQLLAETLFDMSGVHNNPVRLSDLIVEAFNRYPTRLSLKFYEGVYPDSNRVIVEIVKWSKIFERCNEGDVRMYRLTYDAFLQISNSTSHKIYDLGKASQKLRDEAIKKAKQTELQWPSTV